MSESPVGIKIVADRYRLTQDQVRYKVRLGTMPGQKPDKRWQFYLSETEAWNSRGQTMPKPEKKHQRRGAVSLEQTKKRARKFGLKVGSEK